MKICSGCKEEKVEDEFYLNHNSKDGFKARCKSCCKDDKQVSKRPVKFAKKLPPEQEKAANVIAINKLIKQHPSEFLAYVAEERKNVAKRAA